MRNDKSRQFTKLLTNYILFVLLSLAYLIGCNNTTPEKSNQNIKDRSAYNKTKQKTSEDLLIAPDFTLADLNGNTISLSDLKGKVVLLNFWGTWCGPCRKEIPDFINLSKKHKEDGLEIIGVTLTSGPPENIQSFADRWGINYKLLTDINGDETQTVTALYGQATGKRITGIPTTFIIDRDGIIRQRYVGPRTEAIFYQDLKPYL